MFKYLKEMCILQSTRVYLILQFGNGTQYTLLMSTSTHLGSDLLGTQQYAPSDLVLEYQIPTATYTEHGTQ